MSLWPPYKNRILWGQVINRILDAVGWSTRATDLSLIICPVSEWLIWIDIFDSWNNSILVSTWVGEAKWKSSVHLSHSVHVWSLQLLEESWRMTADCHKLKQVVALIGAVSYSDRTLGTTLLWNKDYAFGWLEVLRKVSRWTKETPTLGINQRHIIHFQWFIYFFFFSEKCILLETLVLDDWLLKAAIIRKWWHPFLF